MIYYVEDDTNIRELVVYTLNHSGFQAEGFSNGNDFKAFMQKPEKSQDVQLVLLDIMLSESGNEGLSLLSYIRTHESARVRTIPVIMITAKTSEYDTILGLDSGADDYIKKPFSIMELLSRVRSLLRRSNSLTENGSGPDDSAAQKILYAGPLSIDERRHSAFLDNIPLELTLKEYELLKLFVENPGSTFERDSLLRRIWSYSYIGDTRTVDVHIRTLRRKLAAVQAEYENLIETVRGVGYRLSEKKGFIQ